MKIRTYSLSKLRDMASYVTSKEAGEWKLSPKLLVAIRENNAWSHYKDYLDKLDIGNDYEISEEFVISVLSRCDDLFWYVTDNQIRLFDGRAGSKAQFTALAAFERFGFENIWEAFEYGSKSIS